MSSLAKGQNGPLPAGPITVTVGLPVPADVSALLVSDTGKVCTDADFVFFNQPTGPAVVFSGGALRIDPSLVPADIAQVRVVITLDDAASSFGRSAPPVAHLADAAGAPAYSYVVEGLNSESVVIAVEVYRRGANWKVRAVGQGYAGGFADLIRDHGVSVDDAPPPPPAPAPTSRGPVDHFGTAPAQPGPGAAPQPFPPTAQLAGQQPSGEISLTKNKRVDLRKGQKVTLTKDGGVQLTQIMMGLGRDPVRTGGMFGRAKDIDLDASVLMYAGAEVASVVYFGKLASKDGSIRHSGDNLTGAGDGDDEVINVNLPRVPPQVTTLVFLVTSYRGQRFDQVANAYCRLVDSTSGIELARFALAGGMPHTGVVMCTISRQGGQWKLQAIGEPIDAKTPRDAMPQLGRFLS